MKSTAASRLICNLNATFDHDGDSGTRPDNGGTPTAELPVGGIPTITVSEGFDDAWETTLGGTVITIATLNLPDGVELRWPMTATFVDPDPACQVKPPQVWATLTLSGDCPYSSRG